MGSPASGNRRPSRQCTDELLAIDIRALSRAGAIRLGTVFTLSSPSVIVAQGVFWHESTLGLRSFGADVHLDHEIQITRTPCHLGGSRPWFLCPECDKRAAILYLAHNRPCCRACLNLVYRSSRESELERLRRALSKARTKIEWAPYAMGEIGVKPKNMHWRTYARRAQFCLTTQWDYLRKAQARLKKQRVPQL